MRLVGKDLQTKFAAGVAYMLQSVPVPILGAPVLPTTVSGGAGFSGVNMIHPVDIGTAQNQRIGTSITQVKLHTDFQFYLNPVSLVDNNPSQDFTVRMWIVKSKEIRDVNLGYTLPASTLFNLGNGTSGDWSYSGSAAANTISDMTQALLPIDVESWTVLKTHTFRLVKNQDAQQGASSISACPNLTAHQSKNIKFTYVHKGSLLYQESPTPGYLYPSNLGIFAFAVIYQTSGAPWNSAQNPVLYNARNNISFKNA